MRSIAQRFGLQLALVLIAGVVGGGVVAVLDSDHHTTTVTVVRPQPASAENAASVGQPPHTLTPSQIYHRDAPGVVVVTATTVRHGTDIFGQPTTQRSEALGSGFVIDHQGHILTNAHVVVGAGSVQVGFSNADGSDKTYPAKVLGVDRSTDIAVLFPKGVPPQALKPLPLGTVRTAQVGAPVVAIGNPLGEERTLTSGIISAVHRSIDSLSQGQQIQNALQTDAAINHGNSGGPLIDDHGRVIGITSQILSDSTSPNSGNIGIGFAIPIDTAREVARQLIASGHAEHTYLGIKGTPLTSQLATALNIPTSHGVLVGEVVPGSPAAKAGLRGGTTTATIAGNSYVLGGDVITAVNGHQIYAFADLADAIAARKAGQTVTLTIVRDGHTEQVDVQLAAETG
jgi:S1-C subfamily serine protease